MCGPANRFMVTSLHGTPMEDEGQDVPIQLVRSVRGKGPTPAQRSEGRAATRANHGPTQNQIRLRAFQIYEARGGTRGHADEDWAQAERELRRNAAGLEP